MHVKIDPSDIHKLTADDRGRVTLGTEYAGVELELAVVAILAREEE